MTNSRSISALVKNADYNRPIKRSRGIMIVAFLWLFQSIGRLYFAVSGTPAGMGQFLNQPVTYTTSSTLFVMFLSLGIGGLVASFGLWRKEKWGFWGITLTSVTTIAFDVWGYTLESTAVLGFIVPIISLLYLYSERLQFFVS